MTKESLENFLGKSVCFIYSGPSLLSGRIGPTEVSGRLSRIEDDKCIIETESGTERLEISEIDIPSLKKKL